MVNVFSAFAMVFLAEMGDKTQLFLVSLSSKFKIKSIIIGVAAAIAVLNAAAVAVGIIALVLLEREHEVPGLPLAGARTVGRIP